MRTLRQVEGDSIHILGTSGDQPRRLGGISQGGVIIVQGTYDYNELRNKPEIESHVLMGDKTFEDLGLAPITILELALMFRT